MLASDSDSDGDSDNDTLGEGSPTLSDTWPCGHERVFLWSCPFGASVSSGLRNLLMSSSHLFFCLPTALLALAPMRRPRFHFAVIQQGILAALIFSWACLVLLLTCSTSISAVSMSSSVSSLKETSLSWSHSVLELLASSVSSSGIWWQDVKKKEQTGRRALLQLLYEFNETALQECLSEDAVRRNQTTYLWMRL